MCEHGDQYGLSVDRHGVLIAVKTLLTTRRVDRIVISNGKSNGERS